MEYSMAFYSVIISILLFLISLRLLLPNPRRNQLKKLPPSPRALPIIGHLHLLKKGKQPITRIFHTLSQQYGPIVSLKFGYRPVVLVSTAPIAKECFTKNDLVFADRPSFKHGKYINYDNTTIGTANYGDHWRNLRKQCTMGIFSPTQLKSYLGARKDEVKVLLQRLHRLSGDQFVKVEMRTMLADLTTNIIMRMVAGKRYPIEEEGGLEEGRQFRDIMQEISQRAGTTNIGDLIPILEWVDFSGLVKKLMELREKMDWFFQGLIDENRANREQTSFINRLLTLQESDPHYYTDDIIKGLILMLQASARPSSVSVEWAIANLLNNPEVLKKAKLEIDTQIGQKKLIDETDVPQLPYLRSIIQENLRMYPVSPLVPHMASEDCTVAGYHVPRGTMLFANQWAIHRDPNIWEDPTSFKPERFLNSRDEAAKLMVFGMGRRACPGEDLAIRLTTMTLGCLIQCFDWDKINEAEIDMTETMIPSLARVEPLEVLCKSRPNIDKLLLS